MPYRPIALICMNRNLKFCGLLKGELCVLCFFQFRNIRITCIHPVILEPIKAGIEIPRTDIPPVDKLTNGRAGYHT